MKLLKKIGISLFTVQIHYVIVNYLYVAVDGSRKAHFRATKSAYKHIANCPYANSSVVFADNKFNQSDFSFENAMQDLLVANNSNFQTRILKYLHMVNMIIIHSVH